MKGGQGRQVQGIDSPADFGISRHNVTLFILYVYLFYFIYLFIFWQDYKNNDVSEIKYD